MTASLSHVAGDGIAFLGKRSGQRQRRDEISDIHVVACAGDGVRLVAGVSDHPSSGVVLPTIANAGGGDDDGSGCILAGVVSGVFDGDSHGVFIDPSDAGSGHGEQGSAVIRRRHHH